MAITVEPAWDNETIGRESHDLRYTIRGTDDGAEAYAELLANSPTSYAGLIRQNATVDRLAEEAWEGSVRYGTTEPPQLGDLTVSFDTSGGTQHITQSLGTVGAYAASGGTPPLYQGAIGVTRDGVEGVDITIPQYAFTETHFSPAAVITEAYKLTLFNLTGRTNGASFRGFAAGEVLFLGANGARRGLDLWEISYRFVAAPNATGLVVGSISGINKGGWDYLWVRYEDVEDLAAQVVVKRPVAVYVERVYPFGDFSLLGI